MLHDLRQAVRAVTGARWGSVIVVVSLALGTGANAAVYSAVDALLFRPAAGVADPASLVEIYTSQVTGGSYGTSSYPDAVSIANVSALQELATMEERTVSMARLDRTAVNVRGAGVSDTFWDVLRMSPRLGRWPRRGAPHEAVISDDLWQQAGADPTILGRRLSLDGREYVVTAVAPRRFRGLHLDHVLDAWVPLDAAVRARGRGDRRLTLVGRLSPGDTSERLQGALDRIAARLALEHPETNSGTVHGPDGPRRFTALRYARLDPAIRARAALLAVVLLGLTALLLASACVNTGALLLSRGIARRTELTIKTALGAARARLVRQMLLEGLLLSMSGALAGLLIARWTAGAIPALFAPEHAALLDVHIERPVIATALLVGALTGILCGMAPGLLSTRALSPDALRGDASRIGDGEAAPRMRMVLVGAQLALSLILLVTCALLARTVDSALQMDVSKVAGSLLVASIETRDPLYRGSAMDRLRRVPSLDDAGWIVTPPLARALHRTFVVRHGATSEPVEFEVNFASGGYFRATRDPILEGRPFSANDDVSTTEHVIVNEALAERYFPNGAIGRPLEDADGARAEIVGVVRTRSYRALEGPIRPMVYYPIARATTRVFYAIVRGKANEDAPSLTSATKDALETPDVTKLEIGTFQAHLTGALGTDRLIVTLVGASGVLALLLAVAGVYGVMTDAVERRRREIALRVALGAGAAQIARTVSTGVLAPAICGTGAGVAGVLFLARIGRSFVYGVPPIEAWTFAPILGALALLVAAAVAPSIARAVRISPLAVLRDA